MARPLSAARHHKCQSVDLVETLALLESDLLTASGTVAALILIHEIIHFRMFSILSLKA